MPPNLTECSLLLHPQYAFNLFSHNSPMDVDNGYNEEELKMVKETRKIWESKDVSRALKPGLEGWCYFAQVCEQAAHCFLVLSIASAFGPPHA